MSETFHERYGGLSAIVAIVIDFYDRIIAHPSLSRYFAGVEMPRLIDHQTQFIAHAMEFPVEFDEARLARAHGNLGIDDADYDELCAVLEATLADHGVPERDRRDLLARVEACRSLIVGF